MRVEITRATVALDRTVFVGEVVDLPEGEARVLLVLRKAVPASPATPASAPATPLPTPPGVVESAAPAAEHRDPKPRKRR